jgi:hypothetical protein
LIVISEELFSGQAGLAPEHDELFDVGHLCGGGSTLSWGCALINAEIRDRGFLFLELGRRRALPFDPWDER